MNKNYFISFLLTGIILLFSQAKLSAQSQELGIRLAGLQDFDFIYKKEKANNRYVRYRLGVANISYIHREAGDGLFNFNISFARGVEKRKEIQDKLLFIHGLEPFLNFGYGAASSNNTYNVNTGLGYVLGFQYNFSDELYLNAETIPSLNVATNFGDNIETIYRFGAGFNSNALSLTLAYRFPIKTKE